MTTYNLYVMQLGTKTKKSGSQKTRHDGTISYNQRTLDLGTVTRELGITKLQVINKKTRIG